MSLLTNTELRVFFKLGIDDAKKVAALFATGTGTEISKVSLSTSGKTNSGPEVETMTFQVTDEHNVQLQFTATTWEVFNSFQLSQPPLPRNRYPAIRAIK